MVKIVVHSRQKCNTECSVDVHFSDFSIILGPKKKDDKNG